MEVTIPQGTFRGARVGDVLTFKGIPYAAAPVGALRFAAPEPPVPHEGVHDATRYGPTVSTPPQRSAVIDALLPDPVRPGRNGLNLNIWTPGTVGSRPVLVWIHGGGFATGAGSTTAFDGSAFARSGVVVVTINYRLAVEGFLLLPDQVANRGLLDQLAALDWVRANIASFGGDPERVTVAGESAGAMSVLTLLAMPRSEGLIRRAISQSGDGHHVHTAEVASIVTRELGIELDLEPTAASLDTVPVETLHQATNTVIGRLSAGKDPRFAPFTRLVLQPVIDGDTLPRHPVEAARAGASSTVDLLLGWNGQEYGLFSAPTGLADTMTDEMLHGTVARLGVDAGAVIAAYREHLPAAGPADLFVAIQSDWFCRVPSIRYAEARHAAGSSAYVYEFAWQPGTFDGRLGACHTIEIPFVFDTLADPWGKQLRGADAPQALADVVHSTWVRFIAGGDPGWPVYDDGRRVRRIETESVTVTDPDAYRRRIWEQRL
ncbi:carboxylesterase/lipase family protein [Nocardia miyunensis]|uniref:carboxylesterase/lipase family protein n=1 Tax=Nocardia miyunensis TaxID=282684 RepID=UPI000832C550|nr:carboxylesterase family protein [Nocardia miyunensis]